MLLLEDGADRDAAIEANRQGWSFERFSNQFLSAGWTRSASASRICSTSVSSI